MNELVKKLKYKDEIGLLIEEGYSLPKLHDINPEREAYRFVFRNDTNGFNHKPVYCITPKRMIQDQVRGGKKISCYALSCFEKKDKAKKRYSDILKNSKKAKKTLGDCLASGVLNKDDGKATKVYRMTHFDLFEYECCNLNNKFSIIEEIGR